MKINGPNAGDYPLHCLGHCSLSDHVKPFHKIFKVFEALNHILIWYICEDIYILNIYFTVWVHKSKVVFVQLYASA